MTINIKCKNCKKEFPLDMSKAWKGSRKKCPHCKVIHTIQNAGFKKIDDQLKKMTKNITIKIG